MMKKYNQVRFSKSYWLILLAAIFYGVVSYGVWGWQIIPRITEGYFGMPGDPLVGIWLLAYWCHAIIHGSGLYFTPLQWAPLGTNLTHNLSFPFIGLIAFPLTYFFGSVVAVNIVLLLTCAVSAVCAVFLFRLFTFSIPLILLSGFIYGFSSYQIAHLMGQLTMVVTFVLPLILYVIVQQSRKVFLPRLTVPVIGILLAVQFFIVEELYVTFGFFMTVVAVIAYVHMKEHRAVIRSLFLTMISAYVVSIILIFPYILHFIQDKDLSFSQNVFNASIDLVNVVVPTSANWVGGNWFNSITRYFTYSFCEADGYLCLPLLYVLISSARQFWRDAYMRMLITSIVAILLCAMGPIIHILGKNIFPGPWVLFYQFPFLKFVMPGRFMIYVFLLIPFVLIYWVENSPLSKKIKIIIAALIFLLMIPNPFPAKYQELITQWFTPLHTPTFLKHPVRHPFIKKNAIVLELPFSENVCYWQMKTNMSFRIANGCLSGPNEYSPVMMQLKAISDWNAKVTLDFPKQFAHYVLTHHVQYIVVENPFVKKFLPAFSMLKTQRIVVGNHTIYRIKKQRLIK